MPDELRLVIGGNAFRGFESVSVSRTIEAAAGTFSAQVTVRDPWPILPGMEYSLQLAGVPVARGFVDKVSPSFSESGRQIQVDGRDRTAELVDCSADAAAAGNFGEWWNASLEEIAVQLCWPFGILALVDVPGLERFPRFALQPGEAAWDAIERACRLRGVLAFADANGDLVITRPTTVLETEALIEGVNLKSIAAEVDDSQRYAEYIVRGQQFGSDEASGELAAQLEGRAYDRAIRAQRRLVILAEGSVSDGTAQRRAEWEATTRAARSMKVTVVVQGWRQSSGRLWAPNQLVRTVVPNLWLRSPMLVSSVTWSLSESEGSTTTLELMRPDAFTPSPEVEGEDSPFSDLVEAASE